MSASVRVVLVSKAMLNATAQKKADLLAAEPGVELTVIAPPFWRGDEGGRQVIEQVARPGWEMVVTPMWLNGHFHVHFYPTLARLIRRRRPDLVHIDEEPYNLATYHAMRIARRVGARALFTTWQNLYRRYPPPFAWIEQYNYRHASYALAANDDAASVLRRKGYRGPVAVFPQFGVDADLFVPRPHREGSRPRIGYVGRLKEEKGLDVLMRAFAPLADRAELVIVGRGPTEDALRRLVADLDLGDRVRFLGSQDTAAVAATMAGLDVLALPSRTRPNWAEQFGRVLVEAMACEVAVVGSSSGEIPRVIGDAGLVFPEDDMQALTACLARLIDDPAERTRLAQMGRQRALAHFTQEQIAHQTYAVWQEMLAGSADAPARPPRRSGNES